MISKSVVIGLLASLMVVGFNGDPDALVKAEELGVSGFHRGKIGGRDCYTVNIGSKSITTVDSIRSSNFSILRNKEKLEDYEKIEYVNNVRGYDGMLDTVYTVSRGKEKDYSLETYSWFNEVEDLYYQITFLDKEESPGVAIVVYTMGSRDSIPNLLEVIDYLESC